VGEFVEDDKKVGFFLCISSFYFPFILASYWFIVVERWKMKDTTNKNNKVSGCWFI
jgi:hypothetical protein